MRWAVAADVQPQLEWERRRRPPAAVAAVAAAVLPLAAGIANAVVYNGAPRASLLSSLERSIQPGPVGELESLHVPLYGFYQDNFGLLLGIALLNAVGVLATGGVLTFLGMAARARRPALRSYAVFLPLAAGALLALSGLVLVIATNLAVSSLLEGPRTVAAVTDWQGGVISAGRWLEGFGRLLLGIGFVLIGLNAMRTGLLTRFMGALGIISGALLVLPIGGPLPIVQTFWLIALAISIGQRWPGAVPPAWSTGRAEPWPSQLEIREAKEQEAAAAARGERGSAKSPGDAPAATPARVPRSETPKRRRRGRG